MWLASSLRAALGESPEFCLPLVRSGNLVVAELTQHQGSSTSCAQPSHIRVPNAASSATKSHQIKHHSSDQARPSPHPTALFAVSAKPASPLIVVQQQITQQPVQAPGPDWAAPRPATPATGSATAHSRGRPANARRAGDASSGGVVAVLAGVDRVCRKHRQTR